ncbi:glycoside hydrolase family 32 protein [Agathobacter sp.]|uniref:glycoside hydrolase family 32 protein n=1 Tax=Agathobacter sp. TaxID=2021311 RepID=UPI002587D601|nr:glycoside hydrolase family 32 protein [Agathobacter sp.]
MNTEMTKRLLDAREYEAKHSGEIPLAKKPVYHMVPPIGWMNDPNGFSMYQGMCHLFFQYHPYNTFWGPMHWGHYTTKDFVSWEMLPCALAPDMDYDKDGCFSGSAVESEQEHILMYTGVKEFEDENGNHCVRQRQCIAVGDGTEYHKSEKNPVISADKLPKGSDVSDFRDPRIWKDEDGYWAVVGSRNEKGFGQIALFHATDITSWEYVSILDENDGRYGEMWECPDFFPLDGHYALIVSPQFMQGDENGFPSGNHTLYFVGEYDKKTHRFHRDKAQMLDWGMDFYASQTVCAPDGRRIMIAWLQNWDTRLTPDEYRWCGMMTFPRTLSISPSNPQKILQWPVREIQNYYNDQFSLKSFLLSCTDGEKEVPSVSGRVIDLSVDVDLKESTEFSIAVAANERYRTTICYDRASKKLTVNRSRSGMKKDFIAERGMAVEEDNGHLKLRILLDRNSIELFANDGECVMTNAIYTDPDAQQILWYADQDVSMDLELHHIKKH